MSSELPQDNTRLVLLVFVAGIIVGLLLRGSLFGGIGAWNNNKVVFGNFLIGFGNNLNTNG
jgi:hypothetical protein